MKNYKNIILKVTFVLIAILFVQSCSDKFEDREGQLNADDLDYTDTEDMIQETSIQSVQ